MDPARWSLIERLFTEALLRGASERDAYLDLAIANDPSMTRLPGVADEVRAMLAEVEEGPLDIEAKLVSMSASAPEHDPWVGRVVGSYRLERRIGEGGMGLVYLGERIDGVFEHSVAVKVLARRLGHADSHRRFEEERRILARLEHPGIARLLDGGSIEQQPYLVMELVIGDPITSYCDAKGMTPRERVELFRRVCEAVQYLHHNLVVHRDLKPANILVTHGGRPKLLDFGIAKILESESDHTITAARALTPEYASPEQVTGQPVTTASDVYALGGLLYRLLSGRSPYGDKTSSPYTLEQAIVEYEPDPLIGVDRDLSTIVEKALRKDARRRYGSAGELSADLHRYLNHEPVKARPDTWTYRTTRFIGRHRVGVALASLAVAGLVAFGGTTYVQARRLEGERNAASLARAESDQVVELMVDLFEQNAPTINPGADTLRLGAFLEQAEARVLEGLDEAPALRSRMQEVLGRVHLARDRMPEAERLLEAALAGHRALIAGDDSASAMMMQQLVKIRARDNRVTAEPLAQEALALQRRVHGARHRAVAEALQDLAGVTVDPGRRVELIQQAIDIRLTLADSDPGTPADERIGIAGMHNSLAIHHWRLGDYRAAREWFEQSLEQLDGAVGPEHPYVLTVSDNLAAAYDGLGDYAAAERLLVRVLDARRGMIQEPSAGVATNLNNLATAVAKQGRLGEAIDLAEQSVAEYRATYGEGHVAVANALRNLSVFRRQAGEPSVAYRLLDEAIAIQEAVGQDATFGTRGSISARTQRINFLLDAQSAAAALDSIASLRPLAEATSAGEPTQELNDLDQIEAWARLYSGDAPAAVKLFEAAVAFAEPRVGRSGATFLEASGGLAVALVAVNETDSARALLGEVLPQFESYGLADARRLSLMREAFGRLP